MKNIRILFLLMTMVSTMAIGQNNKTKTADKYYDQLQYNKAVDAYADLLKKGENTLYVYQRLANSYYYINDTKKAETFYARIIKRKNIDPESIYNYAQSLKANGKASEYNTYMKQFADVQPNDSRAIAFMKDPNYLPRMIDESTQRYAATNMEVLNSKFSDFGVRIHQNDLYFASARNTSRKTYDWSGEPFLDIYRAKIEDGVAKEPELLKGDVNTKYHESTVAISPDGKRMYFDRNDFYNGKFRKGSDGVNQLNIYYAENIEGLWMNINPVPFNMPDYSTGHPAISPDGKTLFFTSDRPGGKGQSDIYKVAINEDGSFGTPENLGDAINTEGREGFPYVAADGKLYFSSDGHLGMGGLDVFESSFARGRYQRVKNMGLGVNSADDDFAFYWDSENEVGYVSSNRKGGKGSDDIYKIEKIGICELLAQVTVVDIDTDQPIAKANLSLYDGRENRLKTQQSGNDGTSEFAVVCDQGHVIQANASGYESSAVTLASGENGVKEIRIALRPIEDIVTGDIVTLNPIHFEFDKHNITPKAAFELDKLVDLMMRDTDLVIKVEAHTDNRGAAKYNQKLSERRANSTVQYIISKGVEAERISGEGFGATRPIHDCGQNCSDAQDEANRRSEFKIVR